MTILDNIVEKTKERVEINKKNISLQRIRELAENKSNNNNFLFENSIKKSVSFICEVKKAFPSKGIISNDFDYINIAKDYERAGASALSCLTEPYYFLGSNEYLEDIKKNISIPVLRKDFTIDEYMIYEAKAINADAVLLIAAILDKNQLADYFSLADSLGLSVIVEVHDEDDLDKALSSNTRIIGINNRNLKTFETSIKNTFDLIKLIPENIISISESGIKSREDIKLLEENKVNAVLIGEHLMRQKDKIKEIKTLMGY
ncbi:indole-3-glycerol phosphate synthase TrpC [Brachyspira murdochii]|uniref:indole-3-glycerol phosphate synthase TrpC n=1 Tax=Brachyspira murdochii TaxID=84378 RepID=UPI000CEE8C22|nr:indole-3-glycerol phosphate synthase TrpC [Brachyspira murdochii]